VKLEQILVKWLNENNKL